MIGAGQAGLSVAYHLQRHGLKTGRDLEVLDRGPGPGGAWQHRWDSLRLGTAHRVANLPGMTALGLDFDTTDRGRPARDVVAEYYGRYERDLGLAVRRPVTVRAVRDDGAGRLIVEHDRGTTTASIVVNATGTWGRPFVPHYPGAETFRGTQLDTAHYRSARDLAGRRVVVVGGGASAIGFVLELEGVAAEVLWATRRPVGFTESPTLGTEAGLRSVALADEAARAGRPLPSIVSTTGVPLNADKRAARDRGLLVERPVFTRIEPDGVRWPDGTFSPVDVILWATGFRAELAHLAPLGLREPGGGIRVADGRSVRDPRVFLAGYGPQASTLTANRAGRRTALQIVSALDAARRAAS